MRVRETPYLHGSMRWPKLRNGHGRKARINDQPVLFARYYGPAHQGGRGARQR
jgi:hypothetical protein